MQFIARFLVDLCVKECGGTAGQAQVQSDVPTVFVGPPVDAFTRNLNNSFELHKKKNNSHKKRRVTHFQRAFFVLSQSAPKTEVV